jgi:hypothetical protein
VDPITTETQETQTPTTDDLGSISDPVVLFTVPAAVGGTTDDEVYQLIFDFSVNKAVARMINVNPMMEGWYDALRHPDGIETMLWACLTQMGKRHKDSIPKDQLKLKITKVAEWLEDSGVYHDAVKVVTLAYAKAQPRRKPESEGENSDPPEET